MKQHQALKFSSLILKSYHNFWESFKNDKRIKSTLTGSKSNLLEEKQKNKSHVDQKYTTALNSNGPETSTYLKVYRRQAHEFGTLEHKKRFKKRFDLKCEVAKQNKLKLLKRKIIREKLHKQKKTLTSKKDQIVNVYLNEGKQLDTENK